LPACLAKVCAQCQRIAQLDIDRAEVNRSAGPVEFTWGQLPKRCRRWTLRVVAGKFAPDYSAWHAELAELKRVYAMNYDRNSQFDPP